MDNSLEAEVVITEIKKAFNEIEKLQKELEVALDNSLNIDDEMYGYDLLKINKSKSNYIVNNLNVE